MKQNTQTKNAEPVEGFTGGHWEVDSELHDSPFHELMNEETVIAHIFNERSPYGITKEEAEANAALIAESKNLFHIVKELVQYLEWREDFTIEDADEGNENVYTKAKAILNRINK